MYTLISVFMTPRYVPPAYEKHKNTENLFSNFSLLPFSLFFMTRQECDLIFKCSFLFPRIALSKILGDPSLFLLPPHFPLVSVTVFPLPHFCRRGFYLGHRSVTFAPHSSSPTTADLTEDSEERGIWTFRHLSSRIRSIQVTSTSRVLQVHIKQLIVFSHALWEVHRRSVFVLAFNPPASI